MIEVNTNERWEMDIFRLDIIRKAKGITHQAIGEQLDMQQSNISKFFSAVNRPSYELIKSIASAIGIAVQLVDESHQINMELVDLEANERMEVLVASQGDVPESDTHLVREWWENHSVNKQRKMFKEYFSPGDVSNIDLEFGLLEEELQEMYERHQ
jgi:transcriptional regulator with XRE-family HTH domain